MSTQVTRRNTIFGGSTLAYIPRLLAETPVIDGSWTLPAVLKVS